MAITIEISTQTTMMACIQIQSRGICIPVL